LRENQRPSSQRGRRMTSVNSPYGTTFRFVAGNTFRSVSSVLTAALLTTIIAVTFSLRPVRAISTSSESPAGTVVIPVSLPHVTGPLGSIITVPMTSGDVTGQAV